MKLSRDCNLFCVAYIYRHHARFVRGHIMYEEIEYLYKQVACPYSTAL